MAPRKRPSAAVQEQSCGAGLVQPRRRRATPAALAVGQVATEVGSVPSGTRDCDDHVETSVKDPKRYAYLFGPPPLLSVTGARVGDILEGSSARSGAMKGARLQVASGQVRAWAELRLLFDRDHMVKVLGKWRGVSVARASQLFDDIPIDAGRPNHEPLGKNCECKVSGIGGAIEGCTCPPEATVRILEAGPLMKIAEEAGNGQELEEMVHSQREVSWREILVLMGRHTLVLRRCLYNIASGPKRVEAPDEAAGDSWVDLTCDENVPAEYLELNLGIEGIVGVGASVDKNEPQVEAKSGAKRSRKTRESGNGVGVGMSNEATTRNNIVVKVPASSTQRPTVEASLAMCRQACEARGVRVSDDAFASCRRSLEALTLGGLKSAHQKCIRFAARAVNVPSACTGGVDEEHQAGPESDEHAEEFEVPSELFASMACALMFASSGTFSPELQLFTRGATAALKRTAVILIEDSWVPGASVRTLLAGALLCQVMPSWNPPEGLMRLTLDASIDAATSRSALVYVAGSSDGTPSFISKARASELALAAKLLRVVRSFACDMDMFDQVASRAAAQNVRITTCSAEDLPVAMPVCHFVDQHAYRGIGHVVRGLGVEFSAIFSTVFRSVTGVNPRRGNRCVRDFERQPVVMALRFAQREVLKFALSHPRRQLPVNAVGTLRVGVDVGVLAAAVGPVSVSVSVEGRTKNLVVTLGICEPADEVVMRKPSRDTKDLYADVSDDEKLAAIAQVRAVPQRLHSPFPIGQWAIFQNGEWHVGRSRHSGDDSVPWIAVVNKGVEVNFDVHPAPSSEWFGLDDDSHVSSSLSVVGSGLVIGAEAGVKNLCTKVSLSVILRALSLMRQEYTRVCMPTPALDGGLSGDNLMAYAGDADVYRFLVAISRLAPGALRPGQVPTFVVAKPMLLLEVQSWLQSAIGYDAAIVCASENSSSVRSATAAVNKERWCQFVVDHRVLMAHQLDAVQDMLMRDAAGAPGHFVVMDTGFGKTLTAISYIRRFLDTGVVDVRSVLWVTPTELVEPTVEQLQKKWHAPACILPSDGRPREATINVVKHDVLRKVCLEIVASASHMIVVLDEVDTMYAATQRTSAAHRIAAVCSKLVCQTATPLRSTKNEQLAEWLKRTERFPVDKRNWLVAANGMVSKQIDLGIRVEYSIREVPLTDKVREAHLANRRDWLHVARVTQEATDAALVDEAVKWSHDGVLLVGDDKMHVEQLLALLRGRSVAAGDFSQRGDVALQVVVVTKRHCRGYNEASRLGVLVTGVYAGNGADRYQLLGRLKRIGQRRDCVNHVTVFMRGTILNLLHLRHQSVDTLNISLASLGQHYGAEVLRLVEAEG